MSHSVEVSVADPRNSFPVLNMRKRGQFVATVGMSMQDKWFMAMPSQAVSMNFASIGAAIGFVRYGVRV